MEYDCGMFDRNKILSPSLGTYCFDEVASHSNIGIGVDPEIVYNRFGGEVQVTPTNSEEDLLNRILKILDENLATDNLEFLGTIHVHVRLPNLLQHPHIIRALIKKITLWWPEFAKEMWKWTDVATQPYGVWLDECNRLVKSMVYDQEAIVRMELADEDPTEISRALHNWPKTWSDWKNEWHIETNKVKRPAVNFGHIAINETIEFRPFATSTNPEILKNIIEFPLRFLRVMLMNDSDPLRIIRGVKFQEVFRFTDNPYHGSTSRYFNSPEDQRRAIAVALVNKEITVADLNYPEFWIKKGFQ